VNGVNIYYEENGAGTETVIFIAGFTADHVAWKDMARRYSKQYRTIIFDNRGVGRSDCPTSPYTAEMLADDTKALCDALRVGRAHFIGSSMGGQIVMMLAHKYPQLVKSAVLANSIMKVEGFLTGYLQLLEGQHELIRLATDKKYAEMVKQVYTQVNLGWIFSSKYLSAPGVIAAQIEFGRNLITEVGFCNQINVFQTFDASAWLERIECPCLVIASDADKILPVSAVQVIARMIPGAEFHVFPAPVGHLPHVEVPDEFYKITSTFIAKQCRPSCGTYVRSPVSTFFLPTVDHLPQRVILSSTPPKIGSGCFH